MNALTPVLLGALSLGLFSDTQVENLISGFQVQFFGVCLLAVAAFVVISFRSAGCVTLILTVLLSAAASYTLAAGLLVGLVAIGLAVWLTWPWRHVFVLAIAETVILGCYLRGYRSPVQNSSPLEAIGHPGKVLYYMATEIGGPPATLAFASGAFAVALAVVAGAVILVFLAIRVISLWRNVDREPALGALLATACFCVGFAGLTSLGRWGFGPGQALSGRYQTPMLLFWFCSIALWASRPSSVASTSARPLVLTLLGALTLIVANQPRYIRFALRVEALEAAAIPALLADVADPKALSILSDQSSDAVLDRAEALRRSSSSVFAESWARWLGQPFGEVIGLGNVPKCRGSFDAAAPVGTGGHAGWSAIGHLDDIGRFHSRPKIIFVGGDGRVAEYGVAGLSAVAVGTPGLRTAIDGDRWRGAFKAVSPDRVIAYVLDHNGHASCTLDHGPSIRPQPST